MHALATGAAGACAFVTLCILVVGVSVRPTEQLPLVSAPAGVGSGCGRGAYASAWGVARAACDRGGTPTDAALRWVRAAQPTALINGTTVSLGLCTTCDFVGCLHPAIVEAGRVDVVVTGMVAVVAASARGLGAREAVAAVALAMQPRGTWRARLPAPVVAANLVVQSPHYNDSNASAICAFAMGLP